LAVCKNLAVVVGSQRTLDRPLAVHESHVSELKLVAVTDRTGKVIYFLVKFEYAETAVGNDQLLKRLTLSVDAVREPVQPVLHLSVPRSLLLPLDFHDLAQLVKPEIHPDCFYLTIAIDCFKYRVNGKPAKLIRQFISFKQRVVGWRVILELWRAAVRLALAIARALFEKRLKDELLFLKLLFVVGQHKSGVLGKF
jgi:hypothetical protein